MSYTENVTSDNYTPLAILENDIHLRENNYKPRPRKEYQ